MSEQKESLFDNILNIESGDNSGKDTDKYDLLDQIKARYAQNTKDRKWLAIWAAGVVSLWLLFVSIILFCNNGNFILKIPLWEIDISIKPKLSDLVLNFLLTTTTVNVLGLVLIVLHGHFKISSKEDLTEKN